MYAIVEIGGKQYKVEEGDHIRVEKLPVEPGESLSFDKVLVLGGEELKAGKPYLEGTSVTAEVVSQGKNKKVTAFRYKAKKRVRVRKGHRQPYTEIEITGVNQG